MFWLTCGYREVTNLSTTRSTTSTVGRPRRPSASHIEGRGKLEDLLRERMRKFSSLLLEVLAGDSDEAVHDLRVCSRRLQQVVVTLAPVPTVPPQARTQALTQALTMVRALRRARRSLGGWRDCDVLIDLLERKARRIRNPEEKRVWDMVRALALNRRTREIRRARRRLANRKLFTLAHRAQRFIDELAPSRPRDVSGVAAEVLAPSVAAGYAQWRQALALACDGLDAAKIHDFRIRTKQLRYRIELVRDLGADDTQAALGLLKSLQDELGSWHDRAELFRLTTEAVAEPEFLLKHARIVAALLHKSDREQAHSRERIRRLLTSTNQNIGTSALDDWVAGYCRAKPPQAPTEAEPRPNEQAVNGNGSAPALDTVQPPADQEISQKARPANEAQTLAAEPIADFIKVMSGLPS
jgi:CHAD domain-containing protein